MLTKDYIIGLIEGEGNFFHKKYKNKNNHNVIRFQMGMHHKDIALLNIIQKHLNLGKVYSFAHHSTFVISKKEHLILFIDFIDSSCGLNGNKQEQYSSWKEQAYKWINN